MGHKPVSFIMAGRGTWANELWDPPLPDLLYYTAHSLEDNFGQAKVIGLKRSICVILPRQFNDLFTKHEGYILPDSITGVRSVSTCQLPQARFIASTEKIWSSLPASDAQLNMEGAIFNQGKFLYPDCGRHLKSVFNSETNMQLLDTKIRADEFHLSLSSTQLKLTLQRKI